MMTSAPKTPTSSQAGTAPELGGFVVCARVPGVQRIKDLARGKKLAPSCEAFSAPGGRAVRGHGPKSRSQEPTMTSPYLDRPILSLAVALPQMLAQIEAELPTAAEPAEGQWLKQRTELIRRLLAPRQSPI